MRHQKLLLLLTILTSFACYGDEVKPITYELNLARFSDTYPPNAQYIFSIGGLAFRTTESLKETIALFPKGSILKWAPGCDRNGSEPLLSSEQDMKNFKAYCNSIGIVFVLVPSG